jgi:hypothetical protein
MGEFTHAMRNPIRERDDRITVLEASLAEARKRAEGLVDLLSRVRNALDERPWAERSPELVGVLFEIDVALATSERQS